MKKSRKDKPTEETDSSREARSLPPSARTSHVEITENLPAMIFEYHTTDGYFGKFTFVNNAAQELLEVEPARLMKNSFLVWRQVHQDDRAGLAEEMRLATDVRDQFKWQGRVVTRRAYQLKWVRIHARPAKQPDGSIKWHGVVSDITRLKTVERELEYARKQAEHQAKAKEDFLATMSHEIRTPLNGIVGMTELLLMDASPEQPEQWEQLKLLQFSANNLMALINNILDFSKLNSGKMVVSESKMMVRRVMDNLKHMHNFKAIENRTLLKIHIDPSIPDVVLADEMMFMQIMNNLIGNAIKFTKDGFVTVRLKVEEQRGRTIQLRIAVSDTGVGISEKDLDRIFYEFEQAEDSRNHKGGTGLGLPICKKLVELQGGEMGVQSEPGVGSEFSFTTRFKLQSQGAGPREKKAASSLSRHVNVLIVDDLEENRRIIKNFFGRWGNISSAEASNGKEAIELVQEEDFDIVFLDLRMPVMDGWEACRKIRSMKDLSKATIPIVAITADTFSKKDMKKFTDLLTKPFSSQDLLDMIIKHTDQNVSFGYSSIPGLTG